MRSGRAQRARRTSLLRLERRARAKVEAFNLADPFAAAGIWEKVTITGFPAAPGVNGFTPPA